MEKFNNIKTIIFDFDGTLHKSIKIYEPAFKMSYAFLVENGLAEEKVFTTEEISYWLGFNSKEMWKNFMPDLDEDNKSKSSKIIGNEMFNLLQGGKASLYEGTIEVLQYLKNKGYKLVFFSNCSKKYMETADKVFELNKYFDEFICCEQHGYIPKECILEKVKDTFEEDMIIIGDRFHDIKAGKMNNIYTIGCTYGFGSKEEIEEADILIEDISQLKNLL